MRASRIIGLLAALSLSGSACSGNSGGGGGGMCPATNGLKPIGGKCAGATTEAAATCAGMVCIGFDPNVQKEPGLCSKECPNGDGDCGAGNICLQTQSGNLCGKSCKTNADCCDGFTCTDPGGFGVTICFVTFGAAGKTDCGPKTQCSQNVPQDTLAQCGSGFTQICDCPAQPAGCKVDPAFMPGDNVFCCP